MPRHMTGDNDLKAVVFVTLFRSVRPWASRRGLAARCQGCFSLPTFLSDWTTAGSDRRLRRKRSGGLVSKPAPVACSVRQSLAHSAFNAYYLSIPRKTKSLGDSRD